MSDKKNKKIAWIGCGNMSRAIQMGLQNTSANYDFYFYDKSIEKSLEFADQYKSTNIESLDGLSDFDIVFLAVKPQHFKNLAQEIKKSIDADHSPFIVSIMAGLDIESIQTQLGIKNVSRWMPNMGVEFNNGVNGVQHANEVSSQDQDWLKNMLSLLGLVIPIDSSEQFDHLTATSGAGPAYFYQFMDGFAKYLEGQGFDSDLAKQITAQTCLGAAKVVSASKEDGLSTLISKVTSKGGVTIEGVKVFDKSQLSKTVDSALTTAYSRAKQLREELPN